MLYKTHITSSACLAIPYLAATNQLTVITLGGVVLGAVLPDIDEPRSYIGLKIPIIPNIIKMIFGHRGITHSLLAVGCVFLLSFLMKNNFVFGIAIGYLLHIVGDTFSKSGVKWFNPFSNKSIRLPGGLGYKTGGAIEYIIFTLTSCILAYEVYNIYFLGTNLTRVLKGVL